MTGDKLLVTLKKELDKENIKLCYSQEEFSNGDLIHHLFVIDGDTEYTDKDNSLVNLIGRFLITYKSK